MTGEVKIRTISKVEAIHLEFIQQHSRKRITKASFYFYSERPKDCILVEALDSNGALVGLSFVGIKEGKCAHSVTVVSSAKRRSGIGTALVQQKAQICRDKGLLLTTTVALDNIASLKLCSKFGLAVQHPDRA